MTARPWWCRLSTGRGGPAEPSAPGRFGPAELRLALAAPRPAAGLTSEWRLVDGIRTHCRRSAAAVDGRLPVLLLHGLAVSHRYLTPLAVALADTHPVYVPDLPGFGLSGPPPQPYDAVRHAGHLAAWLAAYRLGPVCVLGHSFGAEVAAALAARHPDAVRALVLAGTTSDPTARSRWGQVGRFLVDTTREAKLQAPILLRDVLDAGPHRVHATLTHSVRHAVESDLARVEVPTLVVTGERDPIVPRPWRDTVGRLVPAARSVTVPGAAHNVATTAPAQVAEAVRTFLSRLPSPEPEQVTHANR
ncbi:alpha/beta fold hydrolase [Micromonospora cathayae]|uniref:Alpha/beta hydrolase n=1 Tax=Micromonospora cathayae TaxID=3028804 RepID=A0ABY7ZXT7_9ACTN|nr:alpha/beta hydrolase [Micromonospora sp. HUAS 3]WDZ87718.1 alpha/beta hydrolase [Micromonospora sp. HUAS 3]